MCYETGHRQLDREGLLLSTIRRIKRKVRGVFVSQGNEKQTDSSDKGGDEFNLNETKRRADRGQK